MQIESRGLLCTETCEIRATLKDYYRTLFATAELQENFEEEADYFIALVPLLQEDDRLAVDGPLTREEIRLAIPTLLKKKTPGPDGLSGEFYIAFQELLIPFLQQLFKEAYERGELSPSFYQDHISLISKCAHGHGGRISCRKPHERSEPH